MGAMQTDTTVLLHKDVNISGTFLTDLIDVQQMEGFSFQLLWENGSTFYAVATVEGSDDLNFDTPAKVYNTVDRSEVPLYCDEGSHTYDADRFHYRYMRLRIEATMDSADFNIYFNSRSRRS